MTGNGPCVAIIPARGGSKRIPHKNIKLFGGQPIISYSIRAAQDSGVFERIIVSTDSDEIADVAVACGAEVPFRRPAELANDQAATAPVIAHALQWLKNSGQSPRYACCIYATAPFIRAADIKRGLEILAESNAATAFTVTTFAFPILRALKMNVSGTLKMCWPQYELTRSQELPEAFHDAGQLYWLDVARFLNEPRLYADDSRAIVLPRYLVQDIDTPEDWVTAEHMHRALKLSR
ncbi:MAG: pseudaminic acid cytidylyltransferase [Rhodospirillaceae bacterium]|nr:pseudaminic acid cytidylyltransferase [Rhodospirillaceae bacterium]